MFFRVIKLSILFILLFAGYNTASATFKISRPSTNNLGLVGHWTFDGKNVVSGVARDISSNGYNGNLINIATSTFYAAGKIGQGFSFDGTDDNVKITGLLGSPANATLSAWAKVNGYDTSGVTLISLGDVLGIVLNTAASPINNRGFFYNGTTWLATYWSANYTNTGWHHFVYTMDDTGNSQKIYVDGVVATSSAHTTSISYAGQGANTIIGRHGNGETTSDFKGNIDDVRVYNRALSAGEVKNLYNQGVSKFNKTPTGILTSGLVGHWTFDGKNVVSGVALDSSGNGNNGNLVNIASSTFYAAGKIGQGFNFDGVNDVVKTPAITLTSNYTIAFWYKNNAVPTGGTVDSPFGWSSTDSQGISFSWDHTDVNFRQAWAHYDTTWKGLKYTTSLKANTWYHLAITFDGTTARAYLNGIQEVSLGVGAIADSGIEIVAIGADEAGTAGFDDGYIDDVRAYNRALSAGEVKMLYNMGR